MAGYGQGEGAEDELEEIEQQPVRKLKVKREEEPMEVGDDLETEDLAPG